MIFKLLAEMKVVLKTGQSSYLLYGKIGKLEQLAGARVTQKNQIALKIHSAGG